MSEKTYTARQLAERYKVAGSTVRGWLLRGLFPSAQLKKTELGDSYWVVPESALEGFSPPKPGPVPKAKTAEAAQTSNVLRSAKSTGNSAPRSKKRGKK